MLLLPARVRPTQEIAVPIGVTAVQVAPPSTEPYSACPACRVVESVAVMVWVAVLVMKSVVTLPVSALMWMPEITGSVESMVRLMDAGCADAAPE